MCHQWKKGFGIRHDQGCTIIRGNRRKDHNVEAIGINRRFGAFQLTFNIPTAFDSRSKSKTLENGVLKIVFPPYIPDDGMLT